MAEFPDQRDGIYSVKFLLASSLSHEPCSSAFGCCVIFDVLIANNTGYPECLGEALASPFSHKLSYLILARFCELGIIVLIES